MNTWWKKNEEHQSSWIVDIRWPDDDINMLCHIPLHLLTCWCDCCMFPVNRNQNLKNEKKVLKSNFSNWSQFYFIYSKCFWPNRRSSHIFWVVTIVAFSWFFLVLSLHAKNDLENGWKFNFLCMKRYDIVLWCKMVRI